MHTVRYERLAAYYDVNVEHRFSKSIMYLVGFRVPFLAEHKCLPVSIAVH